MREPLISWCLSGTLRAALHGRLHQCVAPYNRAIDGLSLYAQVEQEVLLDLFFSRRNNRECPMKRRLITILCSALSMLPCSTLPQSRPATPNKAAAVAITFTAAYI
jgi:hypothetical protein